MNSAAYTFMRVKLAEEASEPDFSRDDAERSLRKLKSLQDVRKGELGRWATLGAVTAPAIGVLRRRIAAQPAKHPLRMMLGDAAAGALTAGAIPYVRNMTERNIEEAHLHDYVRGEKAPGLRAQITRTVGV